MIFLGRKNSREHAPGSHIRNQNLRLKNHLFAVDDIQSTGESRKAVCTLTSHSRLTATVDANDVDARRFVGHHNYIARRRIDFETVATNRRYTGSCGNDALQAVGRIVSTVLKFQIGCLRLVAVVKNDVGRHIVDGNSAGECPFPNFISVFSQPHQRGAFAGPAASAIVRTGCRAPAPNANYRIGAVGRRFEEYHHLVVVVFRLIGA